MKEKLVSVENYVTNHFKLFISMAVGLLVFVGIIAVSVFFVSVRGEEQTMVPSVIGHELSEALLELQVKELYPRIQLRYTQSSADRGKIIEQSPNPGTIVKAGRRVRLVISQGVMINRVENYLGRNLDETRLELQTLFTSEAGVTPLISIREPVMYAYSPEAPGTILQQRPEAGSGISAPIMLDFVVSRGPEDTLVSVPALVSLSVEDALKEIGRSGINFYFSAEPAGGAGPFTVTAQEPAAQTMIRANTKVLITFNPPASVENGEVFGIFNYNMAENPYPLSLRVDAQLPAGEQRNLLHTEYPGGELTVPYVLPAGTVLVLYLMNREIHRQTVN